MKRKILAIVLAAVMMLSMTSFTALASGDKAEAELLGVNTKILDVELPTAENFKFWLDPQGLLGVATETSASLSSLGDHAGKIIFPSDYAPTIVNYSSFAVDVGVAIGITGDATPVSTFTSATGTTTSLIIEAFHNGRNAVDNTTGTETSVVADTTATSTAITATSTSGNYLSYWLDEANFVVTNNNTVEIGEDGFDIAKYTFDLDEDNPTLNGAQFVLSGEMNVATDTSWSAFMGSPSSMKVGLEVKYAYKTASVTVKDDVGIGDGLFAFVEYVTDKSLYTTEVSAGSLGFTVESIAHGAANTWFGIPQFNWGDPPVTITKVEIVGGAEVPHNPDATSGSAWRINASGNLQLRFGMAVARDIRVTLSNGQTSTIKLTV